MNNSSNDAAERLQALNPKKSFIVQAPAGSGKTELLTQRFLVLLSNVTQPEEILAITFTKKSSAEMRARIINSLKNALNHPEPEATHAKQTWNLARRVLKQSQELKWNLLENPNRLRIQTIDSFNAYLTKQLPILSNFGAPPEITNDPSKLYLTAIQEFLSHLEENVEWSESIAQLLLHMDNDLNKVAELLINMLAKRDQWLPYITINANDPKLREKLENHLASVSTDILTILHPLFPKNQVNELLFLANFAANNLIRENSASKITACSELLTLPGTHIKEKNIWCGLSELLLTKEYEWRKRIDKSIGFPSPSNCKNREEKHALTHIKQRMVDFLESLSSHEELRIAFETLNLSPHPQYQEHQWQTLNALHQVLRIAVAQLKLTFQQHGKIDYIESAQAALAALGTEDVPTDMTLALDYQIKHILIDEFQDTSNSQYRLLEKLIAGWETNDGRTLFLVGDPMQSIYRFREAEVGLFIRARKNGLGNIHLEPLTLCVNFRSTSGIVNWVNQQFKQVLPSFEDIAMGAVCYSPSIAQESFVDDLASAHLHPFVDSNETTQAENIVELIKCIKQKNPLETIAILVRSRTHLATIMPMLKKANIVYRAIDIDPLDSRTVIQDLMALTRALLHPADRIAWLSILRAPWCGFSLSDLLILSNNHPNTTIWERLKTDGVLNQLSADGLQRIKRILPILQAKIADRYRFPFRMWLESTWLLLGGPACVNQASDLEDAAAYFNLVEKLDTSGDFIDLDELNNHVRQLYASPNNLADNTLQIMTIHNAKGLEFDTVILPHLERKSPSDDKQLLLWMERPQQDDTSALILAPIHGVGQNNDFIYDYIKRQHAIKGDYEMGRLLYVAVTRAKKQCHLFFSLQSNNNQIANPLSKSLLEKLWPSIQKTVLKNLTLSFVKNNELVTVTENYLIKKRFIHRLTLDWKNPVIEHVVLDKVIYHNKQSGFKLSNNNPKYLGIVIHRVLQQIGRFGITWWENKLLLQQKHYLQNHLIQIGMLTTDLDSAISDAFIAITNTLTDPRGRWIIQSHSKSNTEYQLTAMIENKPQSLIVDRTFVDEKGLRWIIDYKTSVPADQDLQKFLAAAQEKYFAQMHHYAKALYELDPRPIHLGLYFPLVPAWREWQYSN